MQHAEAVHSAGDKRELIVDVPVDANKINVYVSRDGWDAYTNDDVVAEVFVWFSAVDPIEWEQPASFRPVGGIVPDHSKPVYKTVRKNLISRKEVFSHFAPHTESVIGVTLTSRDKRTVPLKAKIVFIAMRDCQSVIRAEVL